MDKSDGATFSQLTYQMLNNNSKSQNIDNINNTLQEEGLSNWYISPELSGKDISTFVNVGKISAPMLAVPAPMSTAVQ